MMLLLNAKILSCQCSIVFVFVWASAGWDTGQSVVDMNSDKDVVNWLIEKYYCVNELVMRELLGKRHIKNRKDLMDTTDCCLEEEASLGGAKAATVDRHGLYVPPISLKSVQRQYDNLRRVQFAYEDHLQSVGNINLVNFLEIHWLMPSLLAKQYAALVFLVGSKFSLSGKKRLQRVSCSDLQACGTITMALFVCSGDAYCRSVSHICQAIPNKSLMNNYIPDCFTSGQDIYSWNVVWLLFCSVQSIDVDRLLVNNLTELKNMLSSNTGSTNSTVVGHEDYSNARAPSTGRAQFTVYTNPDAVEQAADLVMRDLLHGDGKEDNRRIVAVLREYRRMHNTIKALVALGSQLVQIGEYRDFYEDLLTRVVEPLEELGLSNADINNLLLACCNVVPTPAIPTVKLTSSSSSNSCDGNDSSGVYEDAVKAMHLSSSIMRALQLKRDWVRFVTCCRMCIVHLCNSKT